MDEILKHYNCSVADVDRLKKKVKKIEQKHKEPAKPTGYVADSDGWTTVHYRGGRDPTKRHSKRKPKQSKEQKLVNFYAFEAKEAKLKKHKELLEKFEEDKKRLAKMREQRKFKI